jgi:hypothetical protein
LSFLPSPSQGDFTFGNAPFGSDKGTKKIKKKEASAPNFTNVNGVPKGVPKGMAWLKEGDRGTLIAKYLWRGDFVGADAFMGSKGLHMGCLAHPSLGLGQFLSFLPSFL